MLHSAHVRVILISSDALAKLAAAGGTVAASAKECAAGADYVVTMLPSNQTGALAVSCLLRCSNVRAYYYSVLQC